MSGAVEDAGVNCAFGGMRYTSASGVSYVCNGATGGAGAAGVSVTSAVEDAGVNCASGGMKYTSASGVSYVCNGATGQQGPAGTFTPGATVAAVFGVSPQPLFQNQYFVLEATNAYAIQLRSVSSTTEQRWSILYPTW